MFVDATKNILPLSMSESLGNIKVKYGQNSKAKYLTKKTKHKFSDLIKTTVHKKDPEIQLLLQGGVFTLPLILSESFLSQILPQH